MAEPESRVMRGTKAEGEVSFQSSRNAYTAPAITPESARNYFEQNIHLATQIINLIPQVFPGAPDIYVEDRDLERVDDLSKWVARVAENVGIYPSMKISWIDTMSHGCSVKSAGYTYRGVSMKSPRSDLPRSRSGAAATGAHRSRRPQTRSCPVLWDAEQKRVRVFQTRRRTTVRRSELLHHSRPHPSPRFIVPAYHDRRYRCANLAADQQA